MTNDITSWRRYWVIDPDPLAVAQARHIPSGFGVSLKTIAAVAGKPGDPPFVAAISTDDSRPIIDRLLGLGFDECRAWTEEMQEQARTLWRELGLDTDPSLRPTGMLPCRVRSWRDSWNVDAGGDGLGLPVLVHASGLAVRYVYTEVVGEDDEMGWCATEPPGWGERIAALRAQATEHQLARLWQEASILWMELGFFDSVPHQVVEPFGEDWRTLWQIREEAGAQWITHVSGLAITPVYEVVDDQGTQAWVLRAKDNALDFEMRSRVGDRAWQRVHDQGWQPSVPLRQNAEAPVSLDMRPNRRHNLRPKALFVEVLRSRFPGHQYHMQ